MHIRLSQSGQKINLGQKRFQDDLDFEAANAKRQEALKRRASERRQPPAPVKAARGRRVESVALSRPQLATVVADFIVEAHREFSRPCC